MTPEPNPPVDSGAGSTDYPHSFMLNADVHADEKIKYLLDWQARAARTIEAVVTERNQLRADLAQALAKTAEREAKL